VHFTVSSGIPDVPDGQRRVPPGGCGAPAPRTRMRTVLSQEENERLCRVGRGTPMGEMMRRYWLPAVASEDVVAGAGPQRVRLLGDDLVVFRTDDGAVGLLDELCPHRGASLALARAEDCGVRCLYHGWKLDVAGNVIETPAEPPELGFKSKLAPTGYPVYEAGGLIWAYLGKRGSEPPRMDFNWTYGPDSHRVIVRGRVECNWLQCVEGVVDSAHVNFLHTNLFRSAPNNATTELDAAGVFNRPSADTRPRVEAQTTAYGFRYAAIRRPLVDADAQKYVRVTLFVAPFYALIPPPAGFHSTMQMFVPIDDEHTMFFFAKRAGTPLDDEQRGMHWYRAGLRRGIDMDASYRKTRTRENNWLQDRDAMRRGESNSGIHGVTMEDAAIQESMGPIYDRTKEHLGASDVAVIRLRRILLDSLAQTHAGDAAPIGLNEPVPYAQLRAEERIVPLDTPWQIVGAHAGEPVGV
jgi:phthalate 4,5-dioxygenase